MNNFILGDSALSSALTGISGEVTSAISTVAPIAAVIIGSIVGLNFGIKLFKKLTGART